MSSLGCAICKIFSSGNLLYVCESEQNICRNSHRCEDDNNDVKVNNAAKVNSQANHSDVKSTIRNRQTRSELTISSKDNFTVNHQFGGDGDKHIVTPRPTDFYYKPSEIQLRNIEKNTNIPITETEITIPILWNKESSMNSTARDYPETTIAYQNANFGESSSSMSATSSNKDKLMTLDRDVYEADEKVTHRPVICPVTECSKILAANSIYLHFYFDHSKTPVINLDTMVTISVKIDSLTDQSRCIALLLPPKKKLSSYIHHEVQASEDGTITLNNSYDTRPLLLMGARLVSQVQKSSTTRNKLNKDAIMTSNKEITVITDTKIVDKLLMLWICRVTNDNHTSHIITVSSADNGFARSYVGPAVNLRDEQDVVSIYQRAECLVVQDFAISRLCDEENRFNIQINIS